MDIEAAACGSRAYDLVCLAASAARDGAQPGVHDRSADPEPIVYGARRVLDLLQTR